MSSTLSPLAGHPATLAQLINIDQLIAAYYVEQPDPTVASQRVAFGTSGHRGSAFDISFNQWHVLAITQAICDQRRTLGITGPLFMGVDTHALSAPACATALSVLAANGVDVMLAPEGETTPTPAISHAIVSYNRSRFQAGRLQPAGRLSDLPALNAGLADGIVITPSHNPPRDGGFKYNPPHGGAAGDEFTRPIQSAANAYLEQSLQGVRRMPSPNSHAQALAATTTHIYDFRAHYIADLAQVIDLEAIHHAKIKIGVDPMGGAGVHYWATIAERWGLDLTVINERVDPTFDFMTLDWDGQIRMDPSSPYAMQRLIAQKDHYDIAIACDTDHDRHGIVTPTHGLLPTNHYLCVAIDYLFRHRPQWGAQAAIAKSVVTTQLIDRIAQQLARTVYETPVGFKWFATGLLDAKLGFAGEESAGASFLQRDGLAWVTDKDGIAAALLAAEITAVTGRNPGALYVDLAAQFGSPVSQLVEAPASRAQKQRLAELSEKAIVSTQLAGESIECITTHAPGNGAPIGGIKVSTAKGWFAARPSGTESIYKIYAESFSGDAHLQTLLHDAQVMVDTVIGPK